MKDLLIIASSTGLQDAINPCILMTCAVFVAHGLSLNQGPRQLASQRVIFVLIYILGSLFFNFGLAQIFILQKNFFIAARIIYFILGVGSLFLSFLFFKDWFLSSRGVTSKDLTVDKIGSFPGSDLIMLLVTIFMAAVCSMLATIWPIHAVVLILGNQMLLRVPWQTVMPFLLTYFILSMLPLWVVWAFLSIKNIRPSVLKIFYGSVFLMASTSVVVAFQ